MWALVRMQSDAIALGNQFPASRALIAIVDHSDDAKRRKERKTSQWKHDGPKKQRRLLLNVAKKWHGDKDWYEANCPPADASPNRRAAALELIGDSAWLDGAHDA